MTRWLDDSMTKSTAFFLVTSGPSRASIEGRRRGLMSRKLQLALIVAIALVMIKAKAQHQHDMSSLSERGAQVMGFSQEKTTHHFELNQDGGVIEARANNLKDAATLGEIRGHFGHIAKMFAAGDFNAPMLVHAQNVPGTAPCRG